MSSIKEQLQSIHTSSAVTDDDFSLFASCCLATPTSTVAAHMAVSDGNSLDTSHEAGVALALGIDKSLSLNVSHDVSDDIRLDAGNERRPRDDDVTVGGVDSWRVAVGGDSEWKPRDSDDVEYCGGGVSICTVISISFDTVQHCISVRPVSTLLSVTIQSCTKTAKQRIAQIMLHNSPGTRR